MFVQQLSKWIKIIDTTEPSNIDQLNIWLKSAERKSHMYISNTEIEYNTVKLILNAFETHFRYIFKKNIEPVHINTIIPDRQVIDTLCNKKQVTQRTPEWYAQMTNTISASELGYLFGSENRRFQLIMSKIPSLNGSTHNQASAVQSAYMTAFDWGIRFEPVVKQIYCHKYGVIIKELGRLYDAVDNRCSASPDGLIYEDKIGNRAGRLIEIKCPVTREIDISVIPKNYNLQMQMQLHVTECKQCDYVEAQFCSSYSKSIERIGPCLFIGYIALIENNIHEYRYEYSPINVTEKWVPPCMIEGDNIIEMIPWGLYSWNEILVDAKQGWWESITPYINTFWEDVGRARNGTLVIPPKTNKRQPKCLIKVI